MTSSEKAQGKHQTANIYALNINRSKVIKINKANSGLQGKLTYLKLRLN